MSKYTITKAEFREVYDALIRLNNEIVTMEINFKYAHNSFAKHLCENREVIKKARAILDNKTKRETSGLYSENGEYDLTKFTKAEAQAKVFTDAEQVSTEMDNLINKFVDWAKEKNAERSARSFIKEFELVVGSDKPKTIFDGYNPHTLQEIQDAIRILNTCNADYKINGQ